MTVWCLAFPAQCQRPGGTRCLWPVASVGRGQSLPPPPQAASAKLRPAALFAERLDGRSRPRAMSRSTSARSWPSRGGVRRRHSRPGRAAGHVIGPNSVVEPCPASRAAFGAGRVDGVVPSARKLVGGAKRTPGVEVRQPPWGQRCRASSGHRLRVRRVQAGWSPVRRLFDSAVVVAQRSRPVNAVRSGRTRRGYS